MATKGKAAKSSSGAAMSKYDVEVESRLQALEAQAHPVPTGATQAAVDARIDALEAAVKELQAQAAGNAGGVATNSNDTTADHEKLLQVEAALNKVRGVIGV